MKRIVVALWMGTGCAGVPLQELPAETAVVHLADATEWKAGAAPLPPGTRVAVLSGDPTQAAPFVMRVLLPAGAVLGPHVHPVHENVTVLRGALFTSTGTRIDRENAIRLDPGSYAKRPPHQPHAIWTEEETLLQIHATGPWGMTLVEEE